MVEVGFAELAGALPDPLLLVSGAGEVLALNVPAATLCARRPDELLGTHLSSLISDPHRELPGKLAMWSRTRQMTPGALLLRRNGGPPRPLRCDGAVVRPSDPSTGAPAVLLLRWQIRHEAADRFVVLNEQIAALNREVAQRKRSEAEVTAQREWLRVTLASIGDAVIATDRDGRVTFMNGVAERLTGWPQDEAVGRMLHDVFDIINEQTRAPVQNPTAKVLQSGHVVGLANHTVLIARGGVERPIEDSAAPIKGAAGDILGVVLVFHDVSDKKRSEREREHLLAAERAARGEAERSNRLKDEFLATLSHELRTPLNAILGWAQLLRTDGAASSPDELAHGLETIERNARAQARIVDDLLDMSRIMSGKLRLDLAPLDPAPLVADVIESTRPAAQAKQIEVVRRFEPRAGQALADPARLQQVVWNLLTNAIKFTPRGGRVEVRLEREESAAALRIVVSDNGAGIRPEFVPFLFERFRQGDASTTRQHGGLGLGLAISRHLVELHGGTIEAHSEGAGRGATFVVSLPVPAAQDRDTAPATRDSGPSADHLRAAGLPGPARGIDLAGVRILVVDDEPDARALLARLLSDRGATVVPAAGVDEALVALDDGQRPDVLISDIGMPDRDGYDLIRTIRRRPPERGGRIPAVALTAFARSDDRTRALLAGYQLHVPKPVEPHELLAVIASLTGRTKTGE